MHMRDPLDSTFKVAGAPIFTYMHVPDDNEFITDARRCLTTCGVRYVNNVIPICQYTGEVVIFVV